MQTRNEQDASSSSTEGEIDFLSLCEHVVHNIQEVSKREKLLHKRQCLDLSTKLSQTIQNIKGLVVYSFQRLDPFVLEASIRNLHQCLVKAQLLVNQCSEEDWCVAAIFQGQNRNSFKEILVDVSLNYNTIFEIAKIWNNSVGSEDLRESLTFLPASAKDIEEDEEELRKRLECLVSEPTNVKWSGYFSRERVPFKRCLARYLLAKFRSASQEFPIYTLDLQCNAILWKKESEPFGTWGNSTFLGAGSGANGVCRTQWLGVPCARKEFHGQASETTFVKEASILAHLNHPCIVNFICCGNGKKKGDRFIALELMEKSLFDLIEERGVELFSLRVVVDIIVQIARGMRYLHGHGIAHRDLKPQNVVVNRLTSGDNEDYYCVKLVDFGMSKTKVEVSKSNTISVRGVGTTRYRAPEVHPKAHYDGKEKARWFKADVYSFAMTCAHVLSLKRPFEEMEQLSGLYEELMNGKRPELPSTLPKVLVGLLEGCWNTNPRARPSFTEICVQLK